MATAVTPAHHYSSSSHSRSCSNLPSRPTTPLRPPSRTSLRASQTTPRANPSLSGADDPLATLEPALAELSDSMADLEANFMHLQLLNESLGRFNENFAAFLYGLNMSAFCVDFTEAPIPHSFARYRDAPSQAQNSPFRDRGHAAADAEQTFLTTDTSFVENPPTSSKYSAPPSAASARQSMAPSRGGTRGGGRAGGGGGIGRGASARGSGTAGSSRGGRESARGRVGAR